MYQGFEVAAAHSGERTDSGPDTGEVNHLSHLHEAALKPPHLVSQSPMQRHLARRQRTRPQLVFQALNAIGITRAIVKRSGYEEKTQSSRSSRRTLWPCQRQNQVGGNVGTEPFLTPQCPFRLKLSTGIMDIRARLRDSAGQANVGST